MKLGIVYHMPFWRAADGTLREVEGSFARYVDSLAPYFDEISLCVPVLDAPRGEGTPIRADQRDAGAAAELRRTGAFLSADLRRMGHAVALGADDRCVALPGADAGGDLRVHARASGRAGHRGC